MRKLSTILITYSLFLTKSMISQIKIFAFSNKFWIKVNLNIPLKEKKRLIVLRMYHRQKECTIDSLLKYFKQWPYYWNKCLLCKDDCSEGVTGSDFGVFV